MKLYLEFDHDEIQRELPYAIIAETMSRAIWNTERRKRLFAQTFTERERDKISKIHAQAYSWYLVKGVPQGGVKMTPATYQLWHKLADFCANL